MSTYCFRGSSSLYCFICWCTLCHLMLLQHTVESLAAGDAELSSLNWNLPSQVALMKCSVGFFFFPSSFLFEMSAVCLRRQVYSDSQISLLQTNAYKLLRSLLLCDACRPSALLLAWEQQVAQKLCIAGEHRTRRCWWGTQPGCPQAKAREF